VKHHLIDESKTREDVTSRR